MNERGVVDYIANFNHFDFYVDLFRKYFKVFTPATHKESVLSEVQRVLQQFMFSILDYKQTDARCIRNAKDIVFSHWKFTVKNFGYLVQEFSSFIFFSSLQSIYEVHMYFDKEDIMHLYKTMLQYLGKIELNQEQTRHVLTFLIICPNFNPEMIKQVRNFLYKRLFANGNLDMYFEYLTKLLNVFKQFSFDSEKPERITVESELLRLNHGYNRVITTDYSGLDLFRRLVFFTDLFPRSRQLSGLSPDIATLFLANIYRLSNALTYSYRKPNKNFASFDRKSDQSQIDLKIMLQIL